MYTARHRFRLATRRTLFLTFPHLLRSQYTTTTPAGRERVRKSLVGVVLGTIKEDLRSEVPLYLEAMRQFVGAFQLVTTHR